MKTLHFIDCKLYDPAMSMLSGLICLLYDLPGCGCGGKCHIVLDDNNLDDESLRFVINYCDETPTLDSGLSKLICEELLKLTYHQRCVLMHQHVEIVDDVQNIFDIVGTSQYSTVDCCGDCEKCYLTKDLNVDGGA